MSEYDLRNPNPWPKRIVMSTLYVGALVAFGFVACPSIHVPFRWTGKPNFSAPQFQVDFTSMDSSWQSHHLDLLFSKQQPMTWMYLGDNRKGMWLDVATGTVKPAEEQWPVVYRDGVRLDDSLDKWVDGKLVPGRKPKLIINQGERVIDPFAPGVWELGERLELSGGEEKIELAPNAAFLLNGQWFERDGHALTSLGAADGPFRPYSFRFSSFTGVLSLRINGEEAYRQRVRDWNSDDFSRTFLHSGGHFSRGGLGHYGSFFVVVEGSEWRPSRAIVFRINDETQTEPASP